MIGLIEAIVLGLPMAAALTGVFSYTLNALSSDEPAKPSKLPESDIAKLIVELLRSDDGWEVGGSINLGTTTYTHDKGVRLIQVRSYVSVYVANDKDELKKAEITSSDESLIRSEIEAYKTRAKHSRQRELAKALAQRIVDGTPSSNPLLGGPGVPRLPAPSDDDTSPVQSEPAGTLYYDADSEQIVKIGSIHAGAIMDVDLLKRYNLPTKTPGTQINSISLQAKRLGLEYDPSYDLYITRDPFKHRGTFAGKRIKYEKPTPPKTQKVFK